jgi:hypothetical protein
MVYLQKVRASINNIISLEDNANIITEEAPAMDIAVWQFFGSKVLP